MSQINMTNVTYAKKNALTNLVRAFYVVLDVTVQPPRCLRQAQSGTDTQPELVEGVGE